MGLIFFSSIVCPSSSPQLLNATTKSGSSPFTIALVNAGWGGAGNLVNTVILISLLVIRQLFNLHCITHATVSGQTRTCTEVLRRDNRKRRTLRAVVFSNFFGLIALLNRLPGLARSLRTLSTSAVQPPSSPGPSLASRTFASAAPTYARDCPSRTYPSKHSYIHMEHTL